MGIHTTHLTDWVHTLLTKLPAKLWTTIFRSNGTSLFIFYHFLFHIIWFLASTTKVFEFCWLLMLLYTAKLKNYELHVWQSYRIYILTKWEVTIFSGLLVLNFWRVTGYIFSLQSYKLLFFFEKLLLFSDPRGGYRNP